MDQQGLVRKVAIGALQPGTNTAMVVAIIISKSDPRKVTMKKDGTDRWWRWGEEEEMVREFLKLTKFPKDTDEMVEQFILAEDG